MFGAGLNDTEAMPYQVGLKTNGDYRIYNFGVNAYGPHHMLSALEHGYVENILRQTYLRTPDACHYSNIA